MSRVLGAQFHQYTVTSPTGAHTTPSARDALEHLYGEQAAWPSKKIIVEHHPANGGKTRRLTESELEQHAYG